MNERGHGGRRVVAVAAVAGLLRGRGTYPLTGGGEELCAEDIYRESRGRGGEDVEPNCPALG